MSNANFPSTVYHYKTFHDWIDSYYVFHKYQHKAHLLAFPLNRLHLPAWAAIERRVKHKQAAKCWVIRYLFIVNSRIL